MRKPVPLPLLAAALLLAATFAVLAPLLGAERPFAALSTEERQWLDENRDSIILGYDAAFPPLEFQDKNGNYAGLAADIVARVEKLLGVTFQKRPNPDWNALLASLESGETHLNGGMVRTPEREGFAYFTAPYITLPLVIITTARGFTGSVSWADLDGSRVGVVSGYASERFVRERGLGRFEVVPLHSVQEGLRDVSFGVIDAFVDNLATSSYYIEKDALANLRVAGTTDHSFPISIAVSQRHPLLYSAVQKALAEIPGADIDASRKRWVSLAGEGLLSPETERLLKLAALFCALLLLGLAGISYTLRRRLKEKVESLRQSQQELLDQTERLGLATEATNASVWDFYPATGDAYFSDQWYAMLGLKPGAVEATFAGWLGLMHPDDQVATDHALMGYIDTGGQGLFEAEYRMRQADGSYRWVLGKGRAIAWDADGSPTRLVGLNLDIQKLKGVQEELRKSEALAKAALDQTFQFCALLDTQGNLVKINQRAQAFSGVSLEEVAGRHFWDCPWWPDSKEAERFMRQAMATALDGGVVRCEVVQVDAAGKRALLDFSLSPLTGPEGHVAHFIAEGRDITETRQAEAALQQSEEKFRAIFTNAPIGIFRSSFGGGVLEANPALARMHGYESVQDFIHGVRNLGQDVYVRPEDRQRLLDTLLQNPSGASMTVEFRRKDGSTFLSIINAALHRDDAGRPTFIDGTIEDITERTRAEERLRQSEERYRSVIQNMQDIYYRTDKEGRLIMASPSGLKLFGYDSMDEVLGRLTESFYMVPSERQALLAKLAAEGVVRDHEVLLKRRDGSPIQAATTASFYHDAAGDILGMEGIFRDISERKQAEERLRQSEEKFSRIFEMAPECISFVRLEDSLILDANAAFETITGHSPKEAIGRPATELGIWDDPAVRDELLKRLLADGHLKDFEFLLRRKDGALRRVVNSAQLVTIAGGRCYISVIHDITDERRMQELLIQSEKMVSVGGLAAGIAHEINNPLGIVHQAVQNLILRTGPDQKKNLETAASLGLSMDLLQQYIKARKLDVFLEDIQAAALRASGIIRNMLNFSRRGESRRQVCDLHHILEQSVFLASSDYDLKKSYDFKHIEIVRDCDDILPPCNCTETEIEQVVLNLLRNAAQALSMATPPIPNPRIDIRLRAGESSVRIEVADNGPGMDLDTQRKAFEPFFTTKPPGVGTGLGLSVSYFIVTKGHGGRMWLASAPGQGTTFFIELPTEQQGAAHA